MCKKSKAGLGTLSGVLTVVVILAVISCWRFLSGTDTSQPDIEVPAVGSEAYAVLENNTPSFAEDEITDIAYEHYSELDRLGRCGYAMACLGLELMPTEERQGIGQIKPSGWQISKYDFVDGKYLYNRCHLIGFQLAGENANERNLITGTRYLNVEGMLPFENTVAEYIKESDNHVMYRVTPVFEGNDLVARGVQIEALSVEDRGQGICFNVFVHNRQPGVEIDYATGNNWLAEQAGTEANTQDYVLNRNSKRFHYPDCDSVDSISEGNKQLFTGTRQQLIDQGYKPCGACAP